MPDAAALAINAAAMAAELTDLGVAGEDGDGSVTAVAGVGCAGPRTRDLTSSMTLLGALCDVKNVKNN